jgi:hypothetical protein
MWKKWKVNTHVSPNENNQKESKMAKNVKVQIKAPEFRTAIFKITGTVPYCQQRFSTKVEEEMKAVHEQGHQKKKGKAREPKNFKQLYKNALYFSEKGWHGIPATAFRIAMISACRVVGFKMTLAKLSVFVEADGFDKYDGTPLVKITKGKPAPFTTHVRNANGQPDIRIRPLWKAGWQAKVKVRYDADMFSLEDISNLFAQVGLRVGLGEGRPDSKQSAGLGWGLYGMEAK